MGRLRNQTKPQDAVMDERRQRAFELRRAGASYRDIARSLGITHETARKDVNAVLEVLNAQTQDIAREYQALQIQRLDAMLLAVWAKASKGDIQAIDRVLKIEERRARLLGLDAPTRTELSGTLAITWEALMKVNPDDSDDAFA